MPKWIHDRADHLMARNPEMEQGKAFAIATQQAHKLGKTPKGYGTAAGKQKAKTKHTKPLKAYKKTAGIGFKPFKPPKLNPTAKVPEVNAKFLPPDMAGTGADPRKKLQKSQAMGSQNSFDQKTDGIDFKPFGAKVAFQDSEYSGGLSEGLSLGFFKARSPEGMPRNPGGIKVGGPPSELGDKESPDTEPYESRREDTKHASLAAAARFAFDAVGYWEAKHAAVSSPKQQLASSQNVSQGPKLSTPAGPSIAQISKPKGFGTPLPGATKTAGRVIPKGSEK